ncbi:MAG: hypothetical protein A2161_12670 [Candidatus Schekmanbacteria bacterium RBG_13_48_7]|uniref:Uncharacterized protein n=1 Tax=Candidatus Schekmanbacteria bacterium RBG_13_48_7 TaxID=1817878 RepID=A0A1F7S2N0_9BACT|nr:MAG: hypothetical protein A2161_12670 [Candidatus Schekmanbacteria bacterium RBG_13_48_7]
MSQQFESVFNEGKKNNEGMIQLLHRLFDIELDARWQKSKKLKRMAIEKENKKNKKDGEKKNRS